MTPTQPPVQVATLQSGSGNMPTASLTMSGGFGGGAAASDAMPYVPDPSAQPLSQQNGAAARAASVALCEPPRNGGSVAESPKATPKGSPAESPELSPKAPAAGPTSPKKGLRKTLSMISRKSVLGYVNSMQAPGGTH
eukprot:gene54103-28084_t